VLHDEADRVGLAVEKREELFVVNLRHGAFGHRFLGAEDFERILQIRRREGHGHGRSLSPGPKNGHRFALFHPGGDHAMYRIDFDGREPHVGFRAGGAAIQRLENASPP
jgi:hypothetical protein